MGENISPKSMVRWGNKVSVKDFWGGTIVIYMEMRNPIESCTDEELIDLIARAHDEQRRRAAENGGFEAMCENGFKGGFDSKGHARAPEVIKGILVCYGSIVERSTMSHDCSFIHIGDDWVWEHPETMHDEVRKRADRGREHQRSVSLLPALEGMEFDLITCKMRSNVHQMQNIRSYKIENGQVELVNSRNVKTERYHG